MTLKDTDYILDVLSVFNDTKNGDRHFLLGITSAIEIIEDAPCIATKLNCVQCQHYKTENGQKPCVSCSNNYISKFIPKSRKERNK